MKKILILDASLRPGWTKKAALELQDIFLKKGHEVKILTLREKKLEMCSGCGSCFAYGSLKCPKKDDVQNILEEFKNCDGIICAVPNYALQVPALLKNLLDRLAFVFHRPRLFGKTFMPVVVQGIYGGRKILEYLNETFGFWGTKTVKGISVTGGLFVNKNANESAAEKEKKLLQKAAIKFEKELISGKPVKPSFLQVLIFRATRTSMRYHPEILERDKEYYEKNGWFESLYYCEAKINILKRFIGFLVDVMIKKSIKV